MDLIFKKSGPSLFFYFVLDAIIILVHNKYVRVIIKLYLNS